MPIGHRKVSTLIDSDFYTITPQLDKLAPALVALQADLRPVSKDAENPFFRSKYAPLPHVSAALQPLLAKHGLALATFPSVIDGSNGLRFYLIHESGQYLCGEWLLTPAKKDPQGEGSDTTYKRRYGLMAITGLVADEDDDGQAASAPPSKPRAAASADGSELGKAKDRLRQAIKKSGAPGTEYAWVAAATSSQIGDINEAAKALESLSEAEVGIKDRVKTK